MKMIIASNNRGKVAEFNQILKGLDIELHPQSDFCDIEVEESGATFEENALLKARAIYICAKTAAFADDSGLEVDALGGKPGVYSKRFGGEGLDDAMRNEKLLELLSETEDEKRTARFVSVIAYVDADIEFTIRGESEGEILRECVGERGFGYDPLFFCKPLNKTFAQMSAEEKNTVSHRAEAGRRFAEKLKECKKV